MTVRRRRAHLWLAGVACAVAFAMWHQRRRQPVLHPRLPKLSPSTHEHCVPSPSAERPAWPPSASIEAAPTWTLPPHEAQDASWLHRAGVAIHLGRASELALIARELEAAGYPAAAGVLENYALLLRRSIASKSRVLVEVTRLLSTALADPPLRHVRGSARRAQAAGTPGVDLERRPSGTAPKAVATQPQRSTRSQKPQSRRPRAAPYAIPLPSREARSLNTPRSLLALVDRRRAGR